MYSAADTDLSRLIRAVFTDVGTRCGRLRSHSARYNAASTRRRKHAPSKTPRSYHLGVYEHRSSLPSCMRGRRRRPPRFTLNRSRRSAPSRIPARPPLRKHVPRRSENSLAAFFLLASTFGNRKHRMPRRNEVSGQYASSVNTYYVEV